MPKEPAPPTGPEPSPWNTTYIEFIRHRLEKDGSGGDPLDIRHIAVCETREEGDLKAM